MYHELYLRPQNLYMSSFLYSLSVYKVSWLKTSGVIVFQCDLFLFEVFTEVTDGQSDYYRASTSSLAGP